MMKINAFSSDGWCWIHLLNIMVTSANDIYFSRQNKKGIASVFYWRTKIKVIFSLVNYNFLLAPPKLCRDFFYHLHWNKSEFLQLCLYFSPLMDISEASVSLRWRGVVDTSADWLIWSNPPILPGLPAGSELRAPWHMLEGHCVLTCCCFKATLLIMLWFLWCQVLKKSFLFLVWEHPQRVTGPSEGSWNDKDGGGARNWGVSTSYDHLNIHFWNISINL